MKTRLACVVLVLLLGSPSGCGDSSSSGGGDSGGDVSPDGAEDGSADVESDSGLDAANDPGSDGADDPIADREPDRDLAAEADVLEDVDAGDDDAADVAGDTATDADADTTTDADAATDVDAATDADAGADLDADAAEMTCGEASTGDQVLLTNGVCESNVVYSCDGTNRSALGGDCDLIFVDAADGVCVEESGGFAGCGTSVGDPCLWNFGTIEVPDVRQTLCPGAPNGACEIRADPPRSVCTDSEITCNPDGLEPTCEGDALVVACAVDQPLLLACDSYGDGATCLTSTADDGFCGDIPEDGTCNADSDGTGDAVTSELRCAEGLTCEGESSSVSGICTAPCVDVVLQAPPDTFSGNNDGFRNDHSFGEGDCPGEDDGFGAAGQDVVFSFVAASMATYRFTLSGDIPGVLYVGSDCDDIAGTCLGASYEPIFANDKIVDVALDADQEVFVVVDGFSNTLDLTHDFTLSVTIP